MKTPLPAMIACACAAPFVHAQLYDVNIVLETPSDAICTTKPIGLDATRPERVFASSMAEFVGFPSAEEPGFFAEPGALPPASALTLIFEDALRVWDGEDFQQFAPFALEIDSLSATFVSSMTPGQQVYGPTFSVTTIGDVSTRFFHFLSPAAEDGVYLMRFRLENDGPVGDSQSFFWLYDWNAPEGALQAARQHLTQDVLATCPADFDCNGVVNAADLATLLSFWGEDDVAPDIQNDGIVNAADLAFLLSAWGPCPEPNI